ncbi:WhiB family transcriptional regulator [Corynebacterium sp. CCM 8835]|uniref:WhiB family transcriptional regulator n=1 Tax=Corynebacterium antarcticum TaxID=2800405 RepID=UPI001F2E735E|nr:WhiB family transcriptional regulator [Corynebacterium antarcticum]MCK7642182.1 WhiB family transcriptional regulator [Corynebacterium antarcticum]MCL0245882.1 WhiB family transcriptional regulator [Corynebacterium antarcticum]MCX7540456.1 WhiB family transcriptional regulator [Corynebacterium antarcticum]
MEDYASDASLRSVPVSGRDGGVPADGPVLRGVTLPLDALFGAVEQEWQEQALCAETDPEAFFPDKGGSTREAKRICQACGVRDECLEYALEHDERFGIWGGLSERERRRLKKHLG